VVGAWPTHVFASRYDCLHLFLLPAVHAAAIFALATRHARAIVEHGSQGLVEGAIGDQPSLKVRAHLMLQELHEFQEAIEHVIFANISQALLWGPGVRLLPHRLPNPVSVVIGGACGRHRDPLGSRLTRN
jgi:hypothetical protein